MPAANVIQLRQLLAEKFPGLRTRAEDLSPAPQPRWPTGLPGIDALPPGALTEIVAAPGHGGALWLTHLLSRALAENRLVAVNDGSDSLDVTALDRDLSHLLWVRCRAAEEALKAADLLLRDGNLPLILLDLAANPAAQLRKIPATTWYRFQRLVEATSAIAVTFTPRALVSSAQTRLTLSARFSLAALETEHTATLQMLSMEIADARTADNPEAWQQTA